MNKVTSVPVARTRHRLCCLAALALALQIPAGAVAAKDADGDGYEMRVRIKTLTSSYLRVGDRFTAICVDPGPFSGATIAVRIESIGQSGRFKGATEMSLSFDHIRLQNGENYPTSAEIVRLYDTRSGEQVDAEGDLETRGQHRPRTLKRAGIGAMVGGIFGTGHGAAIHAGSGASADKQLVLDQGVEMLIRVYRRYSSRQLTRHDYTAKSGLSCRLLATENTDMQRLRSVVFPTSPNDSSSRKARLISG